IVGLAYVLTGISRFAELSANRGSFSAEGFSWEGPFVALAIGNGRQAGGGAALPRCSARRRSARFDDPAGTRPCGPPRHFLPFAAGRCGGCPRQIGYGAKPVVRVRVGERFKREPRWRADACEAVSRRVSPVRAAGASR